MEQLAARQAHNLEAVGPSPTPAKSGKPELVSGFLLLKGQVGRGTRSKAGALPCDEGGVVKRSGTSSPTPDRHYSTLDYTPVWR